MDSLAGNEFQELLIPGILRTHREGTICQEFLIARGAGIRGQPQVTMTSLDEEGNNAAGQKAQGCFGPWLWGILDQMGVFKNPSATRRSRATRVHHRAIA